MFCSNCGKKIPDDSKFCEKCGTTLVEEETIEETDELDKTIVLEKTNTVKLDKTDIIEEKNITKEVEEVKEEIQEVEEQQEDIKEETEESEDNDIDLEKRKLAGSHTMLLSNLDDAVADLKPDDFDELMPKSSKIRIIAIMMLLLVTAIGIGIYFFVITPKTEKETTNKTDYQAIINEYGKSIEKVAKEYLLDHEIISDYSEIKSLVKYKNHNINCKNIYVNIDGTVYLSECSVDGVSVTEGYGKKKNILTKTGEDACSIKYNSTKGELEFYTEDKLVSVYECKSQDCGLYEKDNFKYNSCLDSIALIKDGKKIYLYSYDAGQELFDGFSEVVPITLKNKNQTLIVKDYITEKYGYITLKGTEILKTEYDELGMIKDGVLLSNGFNLDKDVIIASKNNKYGVINLSTGNQIINFYYNDILIAPNDNYVVKYGNKYYLVDSKDDKVLKESYKMIFPFEDIIVVNNNNKLEFIDYVGNKVIEDTIEVDGSYDVRKDNNNYNVYKKDGDIIIETKKDSYIYNIEKKELVKNENELSDNSNSNNNSIGEE